MRESGAAPSTTQEPIMNDIIIIAAMNSRLFLHRIGWDYEYANRADKTLLHQRRAAAKEGELAAHQPARERIITNLGARARRAGRKGRASERRVACQLSDVSSSSHTSSEKQKAIFNKDWARAFLLPFYSLCRSKINFLSFAFHPSCGMQHDAVLSENDARSLTKL